MTNPNMRESELAIERILIEFDPIHKTRTRRRRKGRSKALGHRPMVRERFRLSTPAG
jgi:hypothetical protein